MNSDAAAKIAMLKGSSRCFVYGMLSLLPVIGLPFAIGALVSSGRARVREKQYWNAAKPYRIWGVICAITGITVGLGVFTIYALILINAYING
jgi:hypothetical protein